MSLTILSNGTVMPSPTSLQTTHEIIWSSDTGRSTASGLMLGDVIAEKKTFSVTWEFLDQTERQTIINNLVTGFFPVSFDFGGGLYYQVSAYRSTINEDYAGCFGGTNYWRSISVQLIQQ